MLKYVDKYMIKYNEGKIWLALSLLCKCAILNLEIEAALERAVAS